MPASNCHAKPVVRIIPNTRAVRVDTSFEVNPGDTYAATSEALDAIVFVQSQIGR